MRNNQLDWRGLALTCSEYPRKYQWDATAKGWIYKAITENMITTNTGIGHLVYINPNAGELFYLWILLCNQNGCKYFCDAWTIYGTTCQTYQDACEALGLTNDDKEWLTTFNEVATWATSPELRSFFCHLLLFYEVVNPLLLWEITKSKMGYDITYAYSCDTSYSNTIVHATIIEQHILLEIQRILLASMPSKTLTDFGLPISSPSVISMIRSRLMLSETNYNTWLLLS